MRHGIIFSKNNELHISVQLYQIKHKYSRVTDNPRNHFWHNSQIPVRTKSTFLTIFMQEAYLLLLWLVKVVVTGATVMTEGRAGWWPPGGAEWWPPDGSRRGLVYDGSVWLLLVVDEAWTGSWLGKDVEVLLELTLQYNGRVTFNNFWI